MYVENNYNKIKIPHQASFRVCEVIQTYPQMWYYWATQEWMQLAALGHKISKEWQNITFLKGYIKIQIDNLHIIFQVRCDKNEWVYIELSALDHCKYSF